MIFCQAIETNGFSQAFVDLFHDQSANECLEQDEHDQAFEQADMGESTANETLLFNQIGDDANHWQYHDIVGHIDDGSPLLNPQMLEVFEWSSNSKGANRGCNALPYHANDPIRASEEISDVRVNVGDATSLRFQVRNLDSMCGSFDLSWARCCVQRTKHAIQILFAVHVELQTRQGIPFHAAVPCSQRLGLTISLVFVHEECVWASKKLLYLTTMLIWSTVRFCPTKHHVQEQKLNRSRDTKLTLWNMFAVWMAYSSNQANTPLHHATNACSIR